VSDRVYREPQVMSRFESAGTNEHGYFEERLSAYLDGELTPREVEAVEHHLETCPECQWDLETIRQTVQWTRELPTLTVPRVFTIPVSAEPERPARRRWSFLPALQGATALIALLLVFAVAGDLMFGNLDVGTASDIALQQEAAPRIVEPTQAVEKTVEEPAEPPMMMVATAMETVVFESEVMVTATQAPSAASGTEGAWRGVEGEVGEEGAMPEADTGLVEEEAVAGGGEPTLALPAPSTPLSVTESSTVAMQLALAPEVEEAEATTSSQAGVNWLRVLEYALGGMLVLLIAATTFLAVERRRAR
jgi:anti-sigma factor RsiW